MKVGVVDVDVPVSTHLKEKLAWAVDKRLGVISTIILYNVFCIGGSKQKECFIYHKVPSVLYEK